ncbi:MULTISPECIES: lytic transglycosylase domain-containing protein [Pseudomonas]|uniref:Membrane-bound lytic murein transglycosylase D n=1 Tax=Pseudomonas segetis TaxID=298908 RepID=A0A239A8Y4_9PSED|nr:MULTISPECIES: lytic transglycosylase domain-containing protein [Pseudomonas]SNR91969.1 membrane-bound lytic murein transglycosylase D [Pseudomonas segetis]
MLLSPRKPLNSKALAQSAQALVVVFCATLAGCQSTPQTSNEMAAVQRHKPEPVWLNTQPKKHVATDIWERVRDGYQLQDIIGINPRIEQQRLWFVSNPSFIENASERSNPYIHYIVEQLEERDMPTELALLPMIESAYNPLALSHANAVGLWQFMPATGRHFNLRQTSWYDGRRDVMASTNAAMNYLTRLHDMFNGDWLLALAAYNAGEGRVSRAIERNQKLGLPTDYWNLSLPTETQNYVPKLLALSQVIMTPKAYGISLSPVANQPYFEQVALKQNMDLSKIAQMMDLDEDELYQLNPAFKRRITMDGPPRLLVPVEKAEQLTATLSTMKPQAMVSWQEYKVRRGDTLSSIANRYHTSVSGIRELNKLTSNRLRVGQNLSLPMRAGEANQQLASTRPTPRSYRVKPGDNLWSIAKANKVSVSEVKRWNKLSGNKLKIGQTLAMASPSSTKSAASRKQDTVTYYKVRKGDSLSVIAQRFKVPVKHLRTWNPRTGSALRPGQTLTLRLPR